MTLRAATFSKAEIPGDEPTCSLVLSGFSFARSGIPESKKFPMSISGNSNFAAQEEVGPKFFSLQLFANYSLTTLQRAPISFGRHLALILQTAAKDRRVPQAHRLAFQSRQHQVFPGIVAFVTARRRNAATEQQLPVWTVKNNMSGRFSAEAHRFFPFAVQFHFHARNCLRAFAQ